MLPRSDSFNKFVAKIDESFIVDLAKEVIAIPSPTGYEEDFARFLQKTFDGLGLATRLQVLYDDRVNVVGRLPQPGSGPTVLLSGHLDTSVVGDETWLMGAGWKNSPVVEDRIIWGNGILNMKGAFVCYAAMLDALRRSDYQFPGDLIVAGTAGEIELGAVDEFHGRRFDSQGVGMRHLLHHGYVADFHILGEPTGLATHIGHMGATWAKVTTYGTFAHTAWADGSVNAIEEMWRLYRELDPWIEEYRKRNEFMGVKPQVNRAAIRGGFPWRAARTPSSCSCYVDIRFPPDRFPIDIQREFAALIASISERTLHRPATVEWYMSRPGALVGRDSPVVRSVVNAHEVASGVREGPVFSPPWCSDAIDSNRVGIPTVLYGLGRTRLPEPDATSALDSDPRSANGEYVSIDDMVLATQVYGAACAELMSLPATEVERYRGAMPGVVEAPPRVAFTDCQSKSQPQGAR